MSILFAENSWPQIQECIERKGLIILPFGTLEEHGLHLPVNVDAVIAEETAKRVADAVKDAVSVLVMPVVWAGYSIQKMNTWPGVVSVRSEILTEAWFDLMASLVKMGFKRLLCMNAHGQNPEMIKLAARRISDEYDVNVATSNCWSMAAETMKAIRRSEIGGCFHGGEFETSLMLYFTDLVEHEQGHKRGCHALSFRILSRRHVWIGDGRSLLVHLVRSAEQDRNLRRSHRRNEGDRPPARGGHGAKIREAD